MGETAPRYETKEIGQEAVPMPMMARRRDTDAKARLKEADSALAAAQGAMVRVGRAIWAARITTGQQDLQSIEGHADAAIRCLVAVKVAAREACGAGSAVAV